MRRRQPDVGIVAMTGGGEAYAATGPEPITPDMICALGADIVLTKPFREDELYDAIYQVARRT